MIAVKGITVCVGYDDLLSITLPRNARHLTEIVVVTSPDDERTLKVVESVPSARCFITDAFTRKGERFNKGAALEEGFDALGRDGWILIWDADILFPGNMTFRDADPKKLNGVKRKILDDPATWHPGLDVSAIPVSGETGIPGYFQLFHSDAAPSGPWYGVESDHAGFGDAMFERQWHQRKKWLKTPVLHLGPRDTNWFGRASPRLDGGAVPTDISEAKEMFRKVMENWRAK